MYLLWQGTNTVAPVGGVAYQGVLNCMSIVDLSTNVIFQPPPTNQTWLLNFGGAYGYRGTNVPSPDIQGHYWNNLGTNLNGSPLVLTNAGGAATAMTFMFDASNPAYTNVNAAPYYYGSDYYNGPSGPVQNPNACVFNPGALGYLGITNAVYSYFIGAHCILQNMNPAHQYSLTFFGSHKYSTDSTTIYSVYSNSSYTALIGSTNLFVGSGASYNEGTVAVVGPISPSGSGSMYFDFLGANGDQGYLNCMQIVDLTTNTTPTDPFTAWQRHYFTPTELGNPAYSGPNADPLGKGISNTNQFLAGFNPNNSAAYPHIISIVKSSPANLVITYFGANGDSTWTPGFASRTNVLEFTTGTANGSYSNNFVSTGQTNILSGGTGLGTVTSFIETNVVAGPTRYYRVRVLVP
jgi:hypothetical protein